MAKAYGIWHSDKIHPEYDPSVQCISEASAHEMLAEPVPKNWRGGGGRVCINHPLTGKD